MLDAAGQELASAELVVVAAGYGSRALAVAAAEGVERPLALQAIRGQVSWAFHAPGVTALLPGFPVNGHGSLVPAVPLAEGLAWVTGSSFERDNTSRLSLPEDDQHNLEKLKTLLPSVASELQPAWGNGQINSWAGVRCATPSRLPVLGPLDAQEVPDLWVCRIQCASRPTKNRLPPSSSRPRSPV